MEQWNIAVIGAGASGLMAAWQAAKALGPGSVLLLEGNPKPGKKLLATGNGRCNLTNLHIAPQHYHGDVEAAAPLLARYPAQRVMDAFGGMGLLCRADGETCIAQVDGERLGAVSRSQAVALVEAVRPG